jgi:hypothetical protein
LLFRIDPERDTLVPAPENNSLFAMGTSNQALSPVDGKKAVTETWPLSLNDKVSILVRSTKFVSAKPSEMIIRGLSLASWQYHCRLL